MEEPQKLSPEEKKTEYHKNYYEKIKSAKSQYYKDYYERNREHILAKSKKNRGEKLENARGRGRPRKYDTEEDKVNDEK